MQFVDWIVKQTGKISDNFNHYKFYVKHQPEIIDSSSILSLNTYVSRDMAATIPCSFRWFKIRNGVTTQVSQFKGNTFICEPSDVGCILQAQITSSDPEHNGTALLRYGPVKFDVLLKKQIQMALSSGQSNFYVDIINKNTIKQCILKVSEQRISISHLHSQSSYTFNYCMIEPKIEVLYKAPTKIEIIFNPKYDQELRKFLIKIFNQQVLSEQMLRNPFLQINFSNRKAKDSFIFITKAFNAKKQLKSSSYVMNLQKQLDFSNLQSNKNNKTYDFVEQISQLQYDISKLLEINSKNYFQKRTYLQENRRLEKQIEQIVGTYLKIIEQKFQGRQDFQKSFVVLKQKQEQIRYNKTNQKQNHELIQKMTQIQLQNEYLKQALKNFKGQTLTPKFVQGSPYLGNIGSANYLNNSQYHQNSNLNQFGLKFKKKQNPFTNQFPNLLVQNSNNKQPDQIQQLKKINQRLEQEKLQITLQYQALKYNYQKLKQSLKNSQINYETTPNKAQSLNLDAFDAKSVRSIKGNNHAQNNYSSLLISKDSVLMMNPQKLKFTSQQVRKPYSPVLSETNHQIINGLEYQNRQLRVHIKDLQQKISIMTTQLGQNQQKYKKKITQLTQQLQMYRRNSDVLNRSQHLSMEMDQYHQEQQNLLKNENSFFLNENNRLDQLCRRYAKKYKNLKKIIEEKGITIDQNIITV